MPSLRSAVFGPPISSIDELVAASRADAARRRERALARAAARRDPTRLRRGLTLRPGADTPLWNELVRRVRPHLRKRGAQAQLARLLSLPRQRLHESLKSQSACLDAERTLLLLSWLAFFERGGALEPAVRPGRSRHPSASPLPGNL
jgi:hypothetical protein